MKKLTIDYKLILASKSPRRRQLLGGLGLPFQVRVLPGVGETYPDTLSATDVAGYISREKADAYKGRMAADELVITADTVVIVDDRVLGKPHDEAEARQMLHLLSGRTHKVETGVCLTTRAKQSSFSVETKVTFRQLSDDEIDYYVEKYRPLDKAGAYGIQEWIGMVGATGIEGSYFNVMGLPVQRIYDELRRSFGLRYA